MHTLISFLVGRADDIGCSDRKCPGRIEVSLTSESGHLAIYFELSTLRKLHRAVGDYLESPDGSTDRTDICRPDAGAESPESLESLALEELEVELTRAVQDVGIDPDGMSDLDIIRALVRRATDPRDIVPAEAATGGTVCELQVRLAHEAVAEWDGQDDDDLVLLLSRKFGREIRGSESITTPVPAEAARGVEP